jgi:hypothetical protein
LNLERQVEALHKVAVVKAPKEEKQSEKYETLK